MPKKNSRSPDRGLVALLVLGIGVVVALFAYVKGTPADRIPGDLMKPKPPVAAPLSKVWVYHAKPEGEEVAFDRLQVPVPKGDDARVYAANEFMRDSKIPPEGSRLVSVDVVEGEAQLHFNDAFDTTYGSTDESTLLKGLQRTFGQFPEINALRFYIGDRPMQTTGNIDLTEPVPVER